MVAASDSSDDSPVPQGKSSPSLTDKGRAPRARATTKKATGKAAAKATTTRAKPESKQPPLSKTDEVPQPREDAHTQPREDAHTQPHEDAHTEAHEEMHKEVPPHASAAVPPDQPPPVHEEGQAMGASPSDQLAAFMAHQWQLLQQAQQVWQQVVAPQPEAQSPPSTPPPPSTPTPPPSGFPPFAPDFLNQIFAQGFVPQASAAQGHPTQEHTAQEHPAQEHPAQGHTAQEHPTQEHTAQGQGTAWEAMQAMLEGMYKNPATLLEQQQAYMQHIADLLAVFPGANPLLSLQENASDAPSHAPSKPHMATPDKRFKNQQWETNPYFALVKQVYQANCAAVMESINARSKDLSPLQKRQVAFQTEQFLNAISPTNYPLTNPEVLQAAIETKGESLLRGMRALLNDLAANDGKLQIRMAKEDTFVLGKDIACTMGAVVHRTPLFELIEYAPQTPVVDATPLLIIPPWINKYYVLDLEPENSMLRWIVDQGVRLFTVSWVNPDATMRETDFEDYMTQGVLESLTVVESLTQATATHLLGYCIGGTLCSVTAAWLAAKGQQQRLRSLTLLTTLVDFHNAGDLSVFVDDQQVTALETKMNQVGYMDGRDMATTFQLLRANDLLWSFYINQYLLGKERGSMALLQWNGDPTRLPAKMHSFYLRNMYLHNLLKQPGGITIAGVPIDLEKVEVPQYLLATAADHIAPWRNCFRATQLFGGESTFVLAGSGHIAGVVNHPRKGKYGYKATTEGIIAQGSADSDFLDQATEHQGSWWPHWVDWMRKVAPEQIPASTTCGSSAYPVLDVAPGRYVLVRTD